MGRAIKPDHTPDPVDVQVGVLLRAKRKELGLSQEALASAMGVSFQQIQKYERGSNRVSASMLARAAKALGVCVQDLFPEQHTGGGGAVSLSQAAHLKVMGMTGGPRLIQRLAELEQWDLNLVANVVQRLAEQH